MTTVVVLFNLHPGVKAEDYERWARASDLPTVNRLKAVRKFTVHKATALLNGNPSPYQYVELIELTSLEDFRAEVKADAIQAIAREFRQFADTPVFMVTESLS
jgi:hypothetical protein